MLWTVRDGIHTALGWNDPESVFRLDRHDAFGSEKELIGVVKMLGYTVPVVELIGQSRQPSIGLPLGIEQRIVAHSRHGLSQ
jgi:hypothetical protein